MDPVIKQLDSSVIKILCSAQVITSPSSVVKELVENALDAKATNVDVKLEAFGLDRIEVRDNGTGVSAEDAASMVASHYTSKINAYKDLEHVTSYGFRGEALSSIASIGDLTVATKKGEEVGISYKYDHYGTVVAQSPLAINQGTSVIVTKLFKTLPVRRQYYTSINKRKEEIKNVENLLKAYAIINCEVRFSLYHDRNLIWQKGRSEDVKSSLQQVFGIAILKSLETVHYKSPDGKMKISAFLPKKNSSVQLMGHSQPDMTFVFVNRRPVTIKFANQILKKSYSAGNALLGSQMKYPVSCLCIQVPTETIDVNIEPSKSQVYFHAKEEVKQAISSLLENVYDLPETSTPGLNIPLANSTQKPSVIHSTVVNMQESDHNTPNNIGTPLANSTQNPSVVQSAVVTKQASEHKMPKSLSTFLDDDLGTGWDILMEETEVADNVGIKSMNGLRRSHNFQHADQFIPTSLCGSVQVANQCKDTAKSNNLNTSQWSKGCIQDGIGKIIKPPQIFLGKEKNCLANELPELEIIDCPKKKKARLDHSTNLTMDSFLESSTQNVNQATQSSPKCDTNRGVKVSAKVVQVTAARQERKRQISSRKLQLVCDKRANNISFFQKVGQDAGSEKSESMKSVVVQFNLDKVKSSLLLSQCSSSISSTCGSICKDKIEVIGELDNGFWIVLQENELKILSHHRLSETLLYQRLMENHDIAKQRLEQPIVLNQSNLGEKEWNVLYKLATSIKSMDATLPVVDNRIVKNGFRIERYQGNCNIFPQVTSDIVTLTLMEVANDIPFYGLIELKECLASIASKSTTTLSECRPLKVVHYLKGEAVRMARAMPNRKSKDDLFTMLTDAKENLPHDLTRCAHGQPFFTSIYNLGNIPEVME